MTLNEYQTAATSTAIFPNRGSLQGIIYCALKLASEAGEVAGHTGKVIRDDFSVITSKRTTLIIHELGDVLWYLTNIANQLDFTLEEIAELNLRKLADRKARGVLGGSGDNR